MAGYEREEAAAAALGRAVRRAWPMRTIERFAPGWSRLFLVALRDDEEGRAAIVAALLDDELLAQALQTAGAARSDDDARRLSHDVLAALGPSDGTSTG